MSLPHKLKVRMLYKTILRLHRGLPPEIQVLGDSYTKDEFHRHKNCNETEAQIFLSEWAKYTVNLSQQLGLGKKLSTETASEKLNRKVGESIDQTLLNDFRDEQIIQLYELMRAATGQYDEIKEVEDVEIIDEHKKKRK